MTRYIGRTAKRGCLERDAASCDAVAVRAIGSCIVNWAKINFPALRTIPTQGRNPPQIARIGVQIEAEENEGKIINI